MFDLIFYRLLLNMLKVLLISCVEWVDLFVKENMSKPLQTLME